MPVDADVHLHGVCRVKGEGIEDLLAMGVGVAMSMTLNNDLPSTDNGVLEFRFISKCFCVIMS